MAWPTRRHVVAWGLSFVFHVEMVLLGAGLVTSGSEPAEPSTLTDELVIDIELPAMETATAPSPAAQGQTRPSPGGEGIARPDSGRSGRAGDDGVAEAAVNMAPRDDGVSLMPAVQTRIDRAQVARMAEAGRGRTSPEDDTVVDKPMLLTFFATGDGDRQEARPHGPTPSGGASWGPPAHRHDGDPSAAREGERYVLRGPISLGGDPARAKSPGLGIADGAEGDYGALTSAVGDGTPQALSGRLSTRSTLRGDHADSVDAEHEVTQMYPSLLAASSAGGDVSSGRGGEAGPGAATGSGGVEGQGALGRVFGSGDGRGGVDPADLRRRAYLLGIRRTLHNAWSPDAFPRSAVVAGRGGYTIVSFTVLGDGRVINVRTSRPSGFPSFDAAMRQAVVASAPFAPLPADLGPVLHYWHEFVVNNPAVR